MRDFQRCGREAAVEIRDVMARGGRWKRVCAHCAENICATMAPGRLRVRPIEVRDQDERTRRRCLDFDLPG
jgi:hypothetical protein